MVIPVALAVEQLLRAEQAFVLDAELFFGDGELFVSPKQLVGRCIGQAAECGPRRHESFAPASDLLLPKSKRER